MQQKRKTLMETRIRWNVWLCQNRDAKHQNYAAEAFIVCVMWHFRASCHHCGVLHQFFSTSWSWITHASCIFSEEKKKRKETAGTCWAPGSPVHQPGPPDNSRWAAASHLCVIIVSVFFFLMQEYFRLNYLSQQPWQPQTCHGNCAFIPFHSWQWKQPETSPDLI